jgi:hypothetical protein
VLCHALAQCVEIEPRRADFAALLRRERGQLDVREHCCELVMAKCIHRSSGSGLDADAECRRNHQLRPIGTESFWARCDGPAAKVGEPKGVAIQDQLGVVDLPVRYAVVVELTKRSP